MKIKNILIIGLSLFFVGCDSGHKQTKYRHRPTKENIESYRVHNSDDSWVYWYLFYDTSTRMYYSSQSLVPLSSFRDVTWSSSIESPSVITSGEFTGSSSAPISELGNAAAEINTSYNVPAENSLDSMEGVPDSTDSVSDSSGDSGGNSGGDSGGDSGGGDSGGGGE